MPGRAAHMKVLTSLLLLTAVVAVARLVRCLCARNYATLNADKAINNNNTKYDVKRGAVRRCGNVSVFV